MTDHTSKPLHFLSDYAKRHHPEVINMLLIHGAPAEENALLHDTNEFLAAAHRVLAASSSRPWFDRVGNRVLLSVFEAILKTQPDRILEDISYAPISGFVTAQRERMHGVIGQPHFLKEDVWQYNLPEFDAQIKQIAKRHIIRGVATRNQGAR